jgi:hypothetical protein
VLRSHDAGSTRNSTGTFLILAPGRCLIALTACFFVYQRLKAGYRLLETDGDPDPLPMSTDCSTVAAPMVWLCWIAGAAAWGVTLVLLIVAGPASAWVLGPIIGTTFILGARLESAHARVMDARRGRPPAAAGGASGRS